MPSSGSIEVRLVAEPGMNFKGFLVKAVTDPGEAVVGSFDVDDRNGVKYLNCGAHRVGSFKLMSDIYLHL